MCKRLFMLLTFVVVLGLLGADFAMGETIEVRIVTENGDAEEDINPSKLGEVDETSSDLEMPYEDEGMGDPQFIGVSYQADIPAGKSIWNAWVRFQVDETKGGSLPVNLIIEGELSPNAAEFLGGGPGTFDISSRPRTAAKVQWSVPNWETVGDQGPDQTTPNIASIIQEIVDQPGWASGNRLVLIFSDDPDNPSEGIRAAEADAGDDSALLHVEFGDVPLDEVWREAEYPDVMGANWAVNSDNAASGLKYLTDSGEGSNTGAATPQWVNTYNFEAVGGDYKILARVIAPNGSDDSLWVRIPTATAQTAEHPDQAGTGWVRFNSIKRTDVWDWDEVHSNDHDNATVIWTLPAGAQTLEIAIREDGTQLDGFVITNNLGLDENTMPSSIDPPPVAGAPIPENGAIEVDASALEWTAPDVAVSHNVYLSTDETIDDADLLGETALAIQVAVLDPGVTYYWRVDAIEADGTVNTGEVWSFATIALEAHFPSPADGATDLDPSVQLSWTGGKVVIMHDVYFGADEAAIAARDMTTFKGKLMTTSYDPGELDLFTTYYWAVDQFTPTGTVAGPVWSFSTAEYILVEGGEATLDYDNSAEPFTSELAFDVPADVTAGGVLTDVTLRFKGAPSNLSIDEATGTYEIAGAGNDIWNEADAFHYVYRELTGDATIVARVTDNGTGSNAWSKGGPMIRQSLDRGSINV
ncbi:MAG: fibronectin type III domain-containing protein, partial [Planctomycetota bacterium]